MQYNSVWETIDFYINEVNNMAATEAQKKAVEKYEREKVDRINCRLPKGLKDRIIKTGSSVNMFIIEAVQEKLDRNGF